MWHSTCCIAGFESVVCGEMPKPDRSRTLQRFEQGALRVITNVGVLTEGSDDPGVSAVAMVRPTRSASLYLQCVGRGMRLSPDSPDCLVLDFVDLSALDVVTSATLDAAAGSQGEHGDTRAEEPEEQPAERLERPTLPLEDPGDEAPATLAEIQERLAQLDPLTMDQRDETAAISLNAWLSLGAKGMMLHFQSHDGDLRFFALKPAVAAVRPYGWRTVGWASSRPWLRPWQRSTRSWPSAALQQARIPAQHGGSSRFPTRCVVRSMLFGHRDLPPTWGRPWPISRWRRRWNDNPQRGRQAAARSSRTSSLSVKSA